MLDIYRYILQGSASSYHWLSSSICSYCLVVSHPSHLLSSPLYDVSEHTNHIFSVRIWSWHHDSVNISYVAELSPVYCCLVPKSFQNLMASWYILYQHGYKPFLKKKTLPEAQRTQGIASLTWVISPANKKNATCIGSKSHQVEPLASDLATRWRNLHLL